MKILINKYSTYFNPVEKKFMMIIYSKGKKIVGLTKSAVIRLSRNIVFIVQTAC